MLPAKTQNRTMSHQRIVRTIALILLMASLCGAQRAARSDTAPQPPLTKEDVAQGGRLFQGWCAGCHGPQGEGGRGPSLAQPRLPRAPDDEALFRVIHDGIDGTEMPRTYLVTD